MTESREPVKVDARGMRCPWPALRAARALRTHATVLLWADDPIAPKELAAMAEERGWTFETRGENLFYLSHSPEELLRK